MAIKYHEGNYKYLEGDFNYQADCYKLASDYYDDASRILVSIMKEEYNIENFDINKVYQLCFSNNGYFIIVKLFILTHIYIVLYF